MKPITLIVLLACLSIGNLAFAQSENQKGSIMIFLKNDGREVDRLDSADFVRVISALDPGSKLYNVSEYYKDKTMRMMAQSWNSEYMKFEGPAIWFYPNGKKKEVCNFHVGKKQGDDYEYYPSGRLYLHKKYPNNEKNTVKDTALFIDYRDSTGTETNLATDGNGLIRVYDDKFARVYQQGVVKNGLRDGEWKGESGDKNHSISFTEVYDNGIMNVGKALYSDENKTYTYTTRETEPQFSGGLEAYGKFLSKNIRYPKIAREKKIQGKVFVRFLVLADGKLSEIRIIRSPDPSLASEVLRVMGLSPNWIPGTQFGRVAEVPYIVPINFSIETMR
jgi:TonB family protein